MGILDKLRGAKAPRAPTRWTWEDSQDWRHWPPPWNAVRDEEQFDATFRTLVGRRRPSGYCTPVEVSITLDSDGGHRAEVGGLECGRVDPALSVQIAALTPGEVVVPGIIRGGFSKRGDQPAGSWGVHVWPWLVLDPPGLDLSRLQYADVVTTWPPRVHEGRDLCPECGLFRHMREIKPLLMECTSCKVKWRPQRERLLTQDAG